MKQETTLALTKSVASSSCRMYHVNGGECFPPKTKSLPEQRNQINNLCEKCVFLSPSAGSTGCQPFTDCLHFKDRWLIDGDDDSVSGRNKSKMQWCFLSPCVWDHRGEHLSLIPAAYASGGRPWRGERKKGKRDDCYRCLSSPLKRKSGGIGDPPPWPWMNRQ